jgi:hypothetical protein
MRGITFTVKIGKVKAASHCKECLRKNAPKRKREDIAVHALLKIRKTQQQFE